MNCNRAVVLSLAALALGLAQAAEVALDFEAGLPPETRAKGDVALQGDQTHGGKQALRVGQGGEVLLPGAPRDGFGTVRLWVYDSGRKLEGDAAKGRAYGPVWGLANTAGQQLVFGLLYAPYLAGNDSYGWISTADGNGWGSRRYARAARTPGWHEWCFTVNNETEIVVSVDGKVATGFDMMTSRFFQGFSGVFLRGGVELDEPLLVDDVRVTWQEGPLTQRTRPLPGEKRPAPEVAPLALKPGLTGRHPRLFFTAADLPALRQRCQTTHQDFYQRLMSGADSYLGQMPPASAAQCSDDQSMQQWAWWRLTTLAFGYVATGDEKYGRKAAEWLDVFASYPDWGSGGEMNQSMGAANMLSGVACAYDWCYDLLSPEQRTRVRDKLLRQVGELYWTGFMDPQTNGYWKGDEQNNHRHHRLCGLLLGALAIAEETPEAAAYVAAAAAEAQRVAAAIPPDGTSHEGPHYSAFGYNYVVLLFEALRHCTGENLYDTPGLRNVPYFRAHLMTPGFGDTFNLGDCGRGLYYFNHYLFRLAAEYRDPAAQALVKAACDANPESFQYYPWCLLWYDADLDRTPLAEIPRWRHFADLELATYRSSWTDPSGLAVLLKCGPYGGHRLNELAQGWVNIAHDHPDANHFMLWWQGQMWATDDGYPKQNKAGASHNLILVDGKGPTQRGTGWLQPIANMGSMGKLEQVTCQDGLFAACGEAAAYYPGMKSMRRWLTVVQDKYVLLCDDLQSDSGPRQYQWLLHSDADFIPEGPEGFALTQGDKTLHLRFALPRPVSMKVEDYAVDGKPHGQVLRVTPLAPAERLRFVAVLAAQPCPDLQATEDAEGLRVKLADHTVVHFAATAPAAALKTE